MPRQAPAREGQKRAAARKKEEVREERAEARPECGGCPIARSFGLYGDMCSLLGTVDVNEFFMHMAVARKEIMLGLRGLLDEAIRIEEERIEKRQSASEGKRSGKQRLRKIDIE
jgi:hypothetical protein